MEETYEFENSSRADERGYSSSAAICIIPGYTHSSETSRSSNKAFINGKTDYANYKCASAFQSTTPPQRTDDTYANTDDETKPDFDGVYYNTPTHIVEENDATHLTIYTNLDTSETYDHVIIYHDDVYDETCQAQASTLQYKSHDRVTIATCETPVSKPNISNNRNNIYDFVA
ncbi:hypothetical protein ACJMK2_021279 [Sinanodonta woodiana]|uniref:Uncharacterized protein n=1 Tax=Sinanodonta woodiana TaxID=1069815 RepID=A0ABD3TFL3_SINWO